MSDPFLGEIRLTPYSFTVSGWASCDGQYVPIDQHSDLFSLLGTTYGGDGRTSFALPNLQGRIPVGQGPDHTIGQMSGSETVPLRLNQMPQHTHQASGVAAEGTTTSPANAVWASSPLGAYSASPNPTLAPMAAMLSPAGGSQPHENRMPYLTLNFQICLLGIYPSRS